MILQWGSSQEVDQGFCKRGPSQWSGERNPLEAETKNVKLVHNFSRFPAENLGFYENEQYLVCNHII